MAKKKKQDEVKPGAPAWVMTYGDMMSLLLTFFVLLVSFSTMQESKFQAAITSLQGAFGVMAFPPTVIQQPEVLIPQHPQDDVDLIRREVEAIQEVLEQQGLENQIEVSMEKDGIAIRISAPFLFHSGKSRLQGPGTPVLEKLARMLRDMPNNVRIEGHTDNVPIATEDFPSNWELSASRAISVLKFFNGQGVGSDRLSAVGYGEFRPVAPNTSAEGRGRNRRVEIYVEYKKFQREQEDALPPAAKQEVNRG